MDTQPNFATPPHKSPDHWFVVAFTIVAVVLYFIASYFFAIWPFESLFPPLPSMEPVATLSPVPSPSSDTSTWQTYSNDEYGFEFQYPIYFKKINDADYRAKFYLLFLEDSRDFENKSGNIIIDTAKNVIDTKNLVPAFVLKGNYGPGLEAKDFSLVKEYSAEWYKFTYGEDTDCPALIFQTQLDRSQILEISFSSCEYYPKSFLIGDKDLQNQILSTFKFTR